MLSAGQYYFISCLEPCKHASCILIHLNIIKMFISFCEPPTGQSQDRSTIPHIFFWELVAVILLFSPVHNYISWMQFLLWLKHIKIIPVSTYANHEDGNREYK